VKAGYKNVTLSLPEPLLRQVRVYAAHHDQSMTSLITDLLRKLVDREADRDKLKRRFIDRIRSAPARGIKIDWKREDLYDRIR
jgi:hypothetical protein